MIELNSNILLEDGQRIIKLTEELETNIDYFYSRIEGMDAVDGMEEIRSFVPLSEMFGYATDLRSKTQGRGTYSMEPSHYEEVPKSVHEQIVSSRAKNNAE